jgi:hypothetical protein
MWLYKLPNQRQARKLLESWTNQNWYIPRDKDFSCTWWFEASSHQFLTVCFLPEAFLLLFRKIRYSRWSTSTIISCLASLYTDRQDYFAKSTTLLFEVAQLSNPFDPSGNATLLVSLVTSLPRHVKGKFVSTRRRLYGWRKERKSSDAIWPFLSIVDSVVLTI